MWAGVGAGLSTHRDPSNNPFSSSRCSAYVFRRPTLVHTIEEEPEDERPLLVFAPGARCSLVDFCVVEVLLCLQRCC